MAVDAVRPADIEAFRRGAALAVIGDSGLNIARLHLEARPVTARLGALLKINAL